MGQGQIRETGQEAIELDPIRDLGPGGRVEMVRRVGCCHSLNVAMGFPGGLYVGVIRRSDGCHQGLGFVSWKNGESAGGAS